MDKSQTTVIAVTDTAPMEPPRAAPHGLNAIIAEFGNIQQYIGPDGQLDARWRSDFLGKVALPFPLPLAWDPARAVTRMTCHRRMIPIYAQVFARILEGGLQEKVTSFGGCFAFRAQRTGGKLSAHSWGIAIDLNPESNPQGSPGIMDLELVQIFRDAGFEWGGSWSGRNRDPMHFQFCTGY